MPLMLSQCEWRQTTNRSQPQIDQLHRLLEIGVTVGLAVLVVNAVASASRLARLT